MPLGNMASIAGSARQNTRGQASSSQSCSTAHHRCSSNRHAQEVNVRIIIWRRDSTSSRLCTCRSLSIVCVRPSMGRGGDFEGGGLRARAVPASKSGETVSSGVKAIRIGKRVVDVTEFASRHPGGKVIEYYLDQVTLTPPQPTRPPPQPRTCLSIYDAVLGSKCLSCCSTCCGMWWPTVALLRCEQITDWMWMPKKQVFLPASCAISKTQKSFVTLKSKPPLLCRAPSHGHARPLVFAVNHPRHFE